MPRNGSGVYSLPSGNPVVTDTAIEASWANTTLSDIATEITGSLPRNGAAPMAGTLGMGNYKILNLADGTAATDAATKGQTDTALANHVAAADPHPGYQLEDVDTAKLDVEQTWTAQQTPMGGSATATTTADWNCDTTGQVYDLAVGTSNFTLNAPTNVNNRACYILRVTQHGTTARTITWDAAYKFPGGLTPALSTGLGAVDIFTFIGGTGNVMHCVGQARGLA